MYIYCTQRSEFRCSFYGFNNKTLLWSQNPKCFFPAHRIATDSKCKPAKGRNSKSRFFLNGVVGNSLWRRRFSLCDSQHPLLLTSPARITAVHLLPRSPLWRPLWKQQNNTHILASSLKKCEGYERSSSVAVSCCFGREAATAAAADWETELKLSDEECGVWGREEGGEKEGRGHQCDRAAFTCRDGVSTTRFTLGFDFDRD